MDLSVLIRLVIVVHRWGSGQAMTEKASQVLFAHDWRFRVRYSETDQLGTFYNSRALEWFECGRTELLRAMGLAYADMEKRGAFLPLVEAHVKYLGRARYDDLLLMTTSLSLAGKASLRFEMTVRQVDGDTLVADGWTLHALTDAQGKVIRPPGWMTEKLNAAAGFAPAAGGLASAASGLASTPGGSVVRR